MKKLLALNLVSMIIIMTSVNVTYATELCESEKEYIVSSKYKRTLTTIDDVDELMDEVTQATICNNEKLVKELENELDEIGVQEVSLKDICNLINEDVPITCSQNNIVYNTVTSAMPVNGKSVKFMRVYARPQLGAEMYYTGSASKNIAVNDMPTGIRFLKVWGEYAIGKIKKFSIGEIFSVYAALRDSISTLTPTSNITRVNTDYVYTCVENTVFLYYYNETTGMWIHMGNSSNLGYAVTAIAKSIDINGNNALPKHKSIDYSGNIKAENYNSAYYMYTHRPNSELLLETQFEDFDISGAAGDNNPYVKLKLWRPQIPASCL